MSSQRSHYDVLAVDRNADAAEIRRAWKTLIQVWHPDRFAGDMREEAERMTTRINEAWSTLRDADARSRYDREQCAPEAASDAAATGRGKQRATWAQPPGSPPTRLSPLPRSGGASNALADFGSGLAQAIRTYPRLVATVAVVWIAVFGTGAVMQTFAGPSMPKQAPAPRAVTIDDVVAAAEDPLPADDDGGLVDEGDMEPGIPLVDEEPVPEVAPPPPRKLVIVRPAKRACIVTPGPSCGARNRGR